MLDASVGVRITDRRQPGHVEAIDAFARAHDRGVEFVAPDVYAYEVGHAIGRFRDPLSERTLLFAQALELVEFRQLTLDELAGAFDLAGSAKLSFYVAAYASLARSLASALWTEDRELARKLPGLALDTAAFARG